MADLKRFWERMRVKGEIPDVRIHDLRHTFASLLASGGASLEMIGRLLGHSQMGQVTVALDAGEAARWMLHCHHMPHLSTGMMTAFAVLA